MPDQDDDETERQAQRLAADQEARDAARMELENRRKEERGLGGIGT